MQSDGKNDIPLFSDLENNNQESKQDKKYNLKILMLIFHSRELTTTVQKDGLNIRRRKGNKIGGGGGEGGGRVGGGLDQYHHPHHHHHYQHHHHCHKGWLWVSVPKTWRRSTTSTS